jgi:hypothetical protein
MFAPIVVSSSRILPLKTYRSLQRLSPYVVSVHASGARAPLLGPLGFELSRLTTVTLKLDAGWIDVLDALDVGERSLTLHITVPDDATEEEALRISGFILKGCLRGRNHSIATWTMDQGATVLPYSNPEIQILWLHNMMPRDHVKRMVDTLQRLTNVRELGVTGRGTGPHNPWNKRLLPSVRKVHLNIASHPPRALLESLLSEVREVSMTYPPDGHVYAGTVGALGLIGSVRSRWPAPDIVPSQWPGIPADRVSLAQNHILGEHQPNLQLEVVTMATPPWYELDTLVTLQWLLPRLRQANLGLELEDSDWVATEALPGSVMETLHVDVRFNSDVRRERRRSLLNALGRHLAILFVELTDLQVTAEEGLGREAEVGFGQQRSARDQQLVL